MGKGSGMSKELERLQKLMAQLRGPGGCPWDREQNHKSILSCLLDETYEFLSAVEENDQELMKEELGDLLLQIVFHSQMAQEKGNFDLEDVARSINDKLIRRHPHVFGTTKVNTSQEVLTNWEIIKKNEKGKESRKSIVDGIEKNLPALFKAEKVQRRVGRVGFDWQEIQPVLEKVEEEFGEFKQALLDNDLDSASEELGDILFALVNVGRHRNICAEYALQNTVEKFCRRFRFIEKRCLEDNVSLKDAPLEVLDTYWEEAKKSKEGRKSRE